MPPEKNPLTVAGRNGEHWTSQTIFVIRRVHMGTKEIASPEMTP